MTEDDDLISALRADLPSAQQEERIRRRLLSAGLLVGGELVSLNAASQTVSASSALGAKLLALSLPVKLGLSAVLAASVAVPLLRAHAHTAENAPRVQAAVATVRPMKPVPARMPTQEPIAAPTTLEPTSAANNAAVETSVTSNVNEPSRARAMTSNAVASPASEPVSEGAPPETKPALASAAPSAVAAFELPSNGVAPTTRAATDTASAPAPAMNAPTSTLAEETRLLDGAFAELAAGNRSAAAALIAEHESRFPNGLLKQERERARDRLNGAGQQ